MSCNYFDILTSLQDFSTSGPPRATYVPKERTYSAHVEPEIPYKIGRAHMKSNY